MGETRIIIELYSRYMNLLQSKQNNAMTNKKKQDISQKTIAAVNEAEGGTWTVDKVKKYYIRAVKAKALMMR